MKRSFVFPLFLVFLTFSIKAQVSVSGYSNIALGVSMFQSSGITPELKIFANRYFGDVLFELDGYYNFSPKEYHQFSLGIGLNMAPGNGDILNAFCLPAQLQIIPLKEFKNLRLVFELCPEMYVSSEVFALRHLWGARYVFGEKE